MSTGGRQAGSPARRDPTPAVDEAGDAKLDALLRGISRSDLSGGDYVGLIVTVEFDGRGSGFHDDVIIGTGVTVDGRLEALSFAVGDTTDTEFWSEFLADLRDRGLHDVVFVAGNGAQLCRVAQRLWPEAEWCRVPRAVVNRLPRGHAAYLDASGTESGTSSRPRGDESEKQVDGCAVAKDAPTPCQERATAPSPDVQMRSANARARLDRIDDDRHGREGSQGGY